MRHTFLAHQWVPYPVEKVFDFFTNPENLPKLIPKWQDARIERMTLVSPPRPIAPNRPTEGYGLYAGAGSRLDISFRPFPLSPFRMSWEAAITDFAWDDHFCDEQLDGPFAYWRHCHRVSTLLRDGVSGTSVVDDLTYKLPLGVLAAPAHALFVRSQMKLLFRYRQRKLLELLR